MLRLMQGNLLVLNTLIQWICAEIIAMQTKWWFIMNVALEDVLPPLVFTRKHMRTSPETRHGRVFYSQAKGWNLNFDLWHQPAFPLPFLCPLEFTPVGLIRGKWDGMSKRRRAQEVQKQDSSDKCLHRLPRGKGDNVSKTFENDGESEHVCTFGIYCFEGWNWVSTVGWEQETL